MGYKAVRSESGEGWDIINTETDAVVASGLKRDKAETRAEAANKLVTEDEDYQAAQMVRRDYSRAEIREILDEYLDKKSPKEEEEEEEEPGKVKPPPPKTEEEKEEEQPKKKSIWWGDSV